MRQLTPTYRRFLYLLSCGIYNAPVVALGGPLSERQWYKIIEEAEKQTVSGVVFSAVTRLPETEMPPVSVLAPWLAMVNREVHNYEAMSLTLARLLRLFSTHGLHPVVQKGHAVARFYPRPDSRAFGDIDLWFPGNERAEADRVISALGIKVTATPDNGSRYVMGKTEVEHHSMLIEVHNPFNAGCLKRLYAKYPPVEMTLSTGLSVMVPAPMVELLMINIHILKHSLGVGIGLRQFCDYALAWRRFISPDVNAVDEKEYLEVCRQLGIDRWTSMLHRFVNRYLPSPDTMAVPVFPAKQNADAVERIFSLVMEGGNFGHYNPHRPARPHRNAIRRKLSTMMSFLNNRSFVCRLVPGEAFWTFTRLLVGQFH